MFNKGSTGLDTHFLLEALLDGGGAVLEAEIVVQHDVILRLFRDGRAFVVEGRQEAPLLPLLAGGHLHRVSTRPAHGRYMVSIGSAQGRHRVGTGSAHGTDGVGWRWEPA